MYDIVILIIKQQIRRMLTILPKLPHSQLHHLIPISLSSINLLAPKNDKNNYSPNHHHYFDDRSSIISTPNVDQKLLNHRDNIRVQGPTFSNKVQTHTYHHGWQSHSFTMIANHYRNKLSHLKFKQLICNSFPIAGPLTAQGALYKPLRFFFSTKKTPKLSKQQIQQATSSDQLVNKIVNLYNFKQYKIPSALALLEAHHQYKIFKTGDWVLDVGAAPNWSWTDLALKLTHGPSSAQFQQTKPLQSPSCDPRENLVISNDLKQCPNTRRNHIHITGDIIQQQIRTKIAMQLLDRQLDVVLIDVTPVYTGDKEHDAQSTVYIYVEVLDFCRNYLRKGGTLVFRTIETALTLQNQQQSKFFFNEVNRYKPSSFRIDSPSFFYIMKGFMMTDNLEALQNMLKQYHSAKTNFSKIGIVEKYRSKYSWDPVLLLNNQAKQRILSLKKEGKKNIQIAKLYQNDPFVKAGEILQLYDIIHRQHKEGQNPMQKIKANRKMLTGSDKQEGDIILPTNKQQFVQILFKNVQQLENEQKQAQRKAKQKKKRKELRKLGIKPKDKKKNQYVKSPEQKAPLGQNQIYMKSSKITEKQNQTQSGRQYTKQDLYGFNPQQPQKPINKPVARTRQQQNKIDQMQIEKIVKSFPEVRQALRRNNTDNIEDLKKEADQTQQYFTNLFMQDVKADPSKFNISDQQLQDILNNNKKSKKEIFQQYQQQEEEQSQAQSQKQSAPKTKSYSQNKNRFREALKDEQQSFYRQNYNEQLKPGQDSEAQIDRILQKRNRQYRSEKVDQEMDQESKVQYFMGEAKKADRQAYGKKQKQKSSTKGSYFKLKNKNKGKSF